MKPFFDHDQENAEMTYAVFEALSRRREAKIKIIGWILVLILLAYLFLKG